MMLNAATYGRGARSDRRILVVEDDEDILDSMSSTLEDAGYRVDACVNGREALNRLQHEPADAVVLDLMMPVMNGWEFVTAKNHDPSIAEIPVVAISADNSPQATAIRADRYIPKPFDGDDLVAAVERVVFEAEQRKLAHRLDETERLALVGLIAAGVGHEINNPLALAMASVTLMDRTLSAMHDRLRMLNRSEPLEQVFPWIEEPLGRVRGQLGECNRDLERIRLIVRELRSVSCRAGDERTLIDVGALLNSVISMATNVPQRVELVRQYEPDVKVLGNESRLSQVFLNLLVNAAQSIPEDETEHRQIFVTTRRDGERAIVEVRDTGRGMTATQKQRIFEPFFTTKGQLGGTGLGLAICKEIVESHDGTIDVSSELGGGSSFTVRLPDASAAPAAARQ